MGGEEGAIEGQDAVGITFILRPIIVTFISVFVLFMPFYPILADGTARGPLLLRG